jgi:hypothetical protein
LKNPKSTLRIFSDLTRIRQKPSFQWGEFNHAIVDENVFSFIRSAFGEPSFLVAMNLSNQNLTVNFQATRLLPSKAKVVYYFDNNLSSSDKLYEDGKDVLTKSLSLPLKSLLIVEWFFE